MDTTRALQALERALARDIADGTVEVRREGGAAVADGGNWRLTASPDGTVGLGLPTSDANYYDEDADAFIENVLNVEVEESLVTADRELGRALSEGLKRSGDARGVRLGERLAATVV